MVKGDISLYTDTAGGEHVAVVTETHEDGTVDLARLPTSHRRVPRAATKVTGTFFDPAWIDEAKPEPAVDAPPPLTGLSSVPRDEGDDVEQPAENPAHGAPADVTPDEPQAG